MKHSMPLQRNGSVNDRAARKEVEKTEYEYPDLSDEKQYYYWMRHMYTLRPAPPHRKATDCLERYLETGDRQYFLFFLHFYELRLNRYADSAVLTYTLNPCHFLDLKQTVVETLLNKVPQYDPSLGVTLERFALWNMKNAVDEYIRLSAGGYTEPSQSHYRDMRKANGIFYDAGADDQDGLHAAMEQMGMTEQAVWELIDEGVAFRYPLSLDMPKRAEDAYTGEADDCDPYPEDAHAPNPDNLVPQMLFMQEVVGAVETLSEREQRILYDSCGIACIYCGRTQPKKSYADIANDWELYDGSTVEKRRKASIRKVRRLLADKGY